jgi:transposase
MIGTLANTRIWVAAGFAGMHCDFDGLAAKVRTVLAKEPFSGQIFVFRGKRGDLTKCQYWRRWAMPARETPLCRCLLVPDSSGLRFPHSAKH